MLFATYPSPAGYTPPPKRNNPLIIVLGVCGGCAALVIIAVIAVGMFAVKSPLGQRAITATFFIQALGAHNYDQAEAKLAPSAQESFPTEKLKQIEESMEAKYGRFRYPAQAGMDMANQKDMNSLSEISYKLHYENGSSTITLRFDPTSKDGGNKIAGVEWDDKSGDSGGDTGDNTGAGHKKSKPKSNDSGQ